MSLREHSLHRQVLDEMHLRRWPAITAPALLVHLLRLTNADERAAETAILEQGDAILAPDDNPRHRHGRIAGLPFVWEAHSEASGITLFAGQPSAQGDDASDTDDTITEALHWCENMPGETLRASWITIVANEAEAEALLPGMNFAASDLVSCHLGSDAAGWARLWSDFRISTDGYSHTVLAANGMTPGDLSRLVQQLQELGDYRNLALLGLPVARDGWKRLGQIEAALCRMTDEISRPDITDDQLLEHVTSLSLDLIGVATAGGFRMSGTAAYAQLVEERLAGLNPRPITAHLSLSDFTQRRLLPAVRTCSAHSVRMADLSERADSFASLLRTRIETRIENQNARLLRSMERSSSLQLRLQQLVEGLSVVALSYYGIGLLAYMLKGAEAFGVPVDAAVLLGGAVPVVVLTMWWGLHRMKRRLLGPH